jgi:energy-converting hydrogenase Eha subunit C
MPEVLLRIINSKKAIYVAIPIITTAIAAFLGYDPLNEVLLVVDAGFAILVVAQTILDAKHGSPSDIVE